jgi:glycerophosphoryl diester phosphodiesterase
MSTITKILKLLIVFIVLPIEMVGQDNSQHTSISVDNALINNEILVAAHRCSWRTAPENSIQALKDCIEMGVDIAEIDLKKTKDNQLIVMHDKTIDRTTTGKGKPEDYTLEEIKKFRLKVATGHPTRHAIPTFEELLLAAKDKILVNIDKGYPYFEQAMETIQRMNMTHQVIYNVENDLPYDSLVIKHENLDSLLYLMVVVNPSSPETDIIIDSYKWHKRTIIQTVFSTDTVRILPRIPEIRKKNPVWFNALWPEHNAGHDDDIAVEDKKPDETWGWLIKKGATIIQTDRPKELIKYIHKLKYCD